MRSCILLTRPLRITRLSLTCKRVAAGAAHCLQAGVGSHLVSGLPLCLALLAFFCSLR